MDSNFLHKESDEAQRQLDRQEGGVASSGDESGEEGSDKDEDRQDDAEQQIKKKKMTGGEKQLRNQFNFSERASQTLNNPYRVMLISYAWSGVKITLHLCHYRTEGQQQNRHLGLTLQLLPTR